MLKADLRVCLDACVLANFGVADLLLRLAEHPRQYLPVWSDAILEEVARTQTGKLGWPPELAARFEAELRAHVPEALVSGYEHVLPAMTNADEDRHVLAAAVHAGADVVLTFNLRDFPAAALAPWGVKAEHPQDYLLTLYEMDSRQVVSRVAAIAAERDRDQESLLLHLGKSVPRFAARLLTDLGLS